MKKKDSLETAQFFIEVYNNLMDSIVYFGRVLEATDTSNPNFKDVKRYYDQATDVLVNLESTMPKLTDHIEVCYKIQKGVN